MADANGAGEAQPLTRDELFPPGWEDRLLNGNEDEPEAAQAADAENEDEEAPEEAQDGDESKSEASEATLGRMKLNDFLDAAGVSLEEFYRDVYVDIGGKEVSISQAWDSEKSSAKALETLSRERDELQAKLSQSAVSVPLPNESVEARVLLKQAEECQAIIEKTDWTQFDNATASAEQLKYINLRDSLVRKAQEKQAEHVQQLQQRHTQVLEESDRQTRAAIPEWNDNKVRTAEWQSIKDLGASYGFSAQEMDTWVDPRARRMLRDFMLSQQQVAKVKAGAKKIRKVSKTLGGGERSTGKARPSLSDASRAIREASSKNEASKVRQSIDLGDLPPIRGESR